MCNNGRVTQSVTHRRVIEESWARSTAYLTLQANFAVAVVEVTKRTACKGVLYGQTSTSSTLIIEVLRITTSMIQFSSNERTNESRENGQIWAYYECSRAHANSIIPANDCFNKNIDITYHFVGRKLKAFSCGKIKSFQSSKTSSRK